MTLRGLYLSVFGFLVVLVASVATGCGDKAKAAPAERFEVKRVNLRDVITQTGAVEPIVKVDIKSEASGKIENVYVREGQRVAEGDTLLIIDPSRLIYKKDRTDLMVEQAKIRLEQAKRELEDARRLAATGTVPQRKVVDAEDAYRLADIEYRRQLLELGDLVDQLKQTVITAPMSGVMTSLEVEEGEIAVSATSGFQAGTNIGTIADIAKLEVISQVGEVDYIHMDVGQKVRIRPEAVRDAQTTGTISFISLSAKRSNNSTLGNFEVRIDIDSLVPGIAPGINVNVDFVVLQKDSVLAVPNHFVREKGERHFVTVAASGDEAEPKPRAVVLGATDYRHYEVVSGLQPGEVIVFRPEHRPRPSRRSKRKRG
ncbi:MAG: efflux RND transporter periplasmic adaptor subunit [Chitinivibrionales bacterium]|nr:efflux RND transporter periplasmic adaptor subunit [Chitinivibrionales bacterium]